MERRTVARSSLLRLESLRKYFPVGGGLFARSNKWVKAVDDVSFEINEEETFGIVGESGCGKTTLGRTVLRLIEPTSGKIYFGGQEITYLDKNKLKSLRRDMQIVFQDPYGALHPRKVVGKIVGEPLEIQGTPRHEINDRVGEMLSSVGLTTEQMQRYPHEFSGGQRQRIMIARALILKPRFLALDEPTSALDASVQALILNLLKDLQRSLSLTYLLISHHLSVVEFLSDRIGVMYLGKIVEIGPKEELFSTPLHPYTQALLSAIPQIPGEEGVSKRIVLSGDVASPMSPPAGCRFHTRCPYAKALCTSDEPILRQVSKNRLVACHYWEEIQASQGAITGTIASRAEDTDIQPTNQTELRSNKL